MAATLPKTIHRGVYRSAATPTILALPDMPPACTLASTLGRATEQFPIVVHCSEVHSALARDPAFVARINCSDVVMTE